MKKKTKQLVVLGVLICIISGALIVLDNYSKASVSFVSKTSNNKNKNDVSGTPAKSTNTDADKSKDDKKTIEAEDNKGGKSETNNDQQSAPTENTSTKKSRDGKVWVEPVYKDVEYAEEGHYESVEVSPARSEEKEVGQKFICDCGQEFPTYESWLAQKEANGG